MSKSHWLSKRKIKELKALYAADPSDSLRPFGGVCLYSCEERASRLNTQSACIVMLSLKTKRPGMIHKDVLCYIVQRFIWPTRVQCDIWTTREEHKSHIAPSLEDVD